MPTSAFRTAVEGGDLDAATALLAEDVVFRSPAVFKPYAGAATVARLLETVYGVFEDFRYTDELEAPTPDGASGTPTGTGGTHALIFEARVGDRELQGMDLIRTDEQGRITELTVMVRPASGLAALAQEMGARLSE